MEGGIISGGPGGRGRRQWHGHDKQKQEAEEKKEGRVRTELVDERLHGEE